MLWRTCTAAPPPPAAPGPTSSCSPAAARRASTTQRLAPTPKCKTQVAVYVYHCLQEFNVLTIFQRNQADAGSIEAFICNQSFWSSWGSSSGRVGAVVIGCRWFRTLLLFYYYLHFDLSEIIAFARYRPVTPAWLVTSETVQLPLNYSKRSLGLVRCHQTGTIVIMWLVSGNVSAKEKWHRESQSHNLRWCFLSQWSLAALHAVEIMTENGGQL